MFGITEFGRAWLTMNVLTSAAREGARLAVVTAPDEARVIDRVNEMNYIYPVSELPFVWGHTTDVVINNNPLSALEQRLGDWAWAK